LDLGVHEPPPSRSYATTRTGAATEGPSGGGTTGRRAVWRGAIERGGSRRGASAPRVRNERERENVG